MLLFMDQKRIPVKNLIIWHGKMQTLNKKKKTATVPRGKMTLWYLSNTRLVLYILFMYLLALQKAMNKKSESCLF